MTQGNPELAIRRVAERFASGAADVAEMWSAFHRNLHDLCSSHPLEGDFLVLFKALERWESAVGTDRESALATAQQAARRLGEDA